MTNETSGEPVDIYSFPIPNDETRLKFEQSYAAYDASLKSKWDKYLQKHATPTDFFHGATLRTSKTLKSLCRLGVFSEYRREVYLRLTGAHKRQQTSSSDYRRLVTRTHNLRNKSTDQIDLDLERTFPENRRFRSPSALSRLHNVLAAFSYKDKDIGYVQSLNYLVGMLLLIMDEEEAFWVLVSIIDDYLPREYFSKNLLAVMTDQRVLCSLCENLIGSRFINHLNNCGAPLDLMTTDWFMCLFTKTLSSSCIFRIWDAFFYEGVKVIFRFSVALLKLSERAILEAHDIVKISSVITSMANTFYDPNHLSKVAFNQLGSFPMVRIVELRHIHRQSVLIDLKKADDLRKNARQRERIAPPPPQPRAE
ncbi:hypothetical protein RCL1_005877 [Eukaryota sp. TZLM3-RCL]